MRPLPPDIAAFVAGARIGHLATVDEKGHPHVVPVCFAYSDGIVYIALDAKPKRVAVMRLRRVRNLLANPNVQLLVDRYDEDWSRLRYVQCRGTALLVDSGPEHNAAIALLRARYSQYVSMPLEQAPIIRIEIADHVAWSASQG